MSIFSDYAVGAMSDEEFAMCCTEMNNRNRYEREHEFDECFDECFDDDEQEDEEDE